MILNMPEHYNCDSISLRQGPLDPLPRLLHYVISCMALCPELLKDCSDHRSISPYHHPSCSRARVSFLTCELRRQDVVNLAPEDRTGINSSSSKRITVNEFYASLEI